ncbi:hypothetical protein [Cellulomonas hominis]|uniref:Uncharacterized protein n=1 Tax=Cellulomonas hominis TaxID=156981 RepID=A0A7W8WA99_9CELL|nr:hypothetical protein [Cellulomonas hominis]MBB5474140.1 hypothetical protein [Cellulomonas hominis]NKY05683.1 hypothetical protein [Cellulomonas hominis]NKY09851.1 hypothetical protein [Cellulomonas hominis]
MKQLLEPVVVDHVNMLVTLTHDTLDEHELLAVAALGIRQAPPAEVAVHQEGNGA